MRIAHRFSGGNRARKSGAVPEGRREPRNAIIPPVTIITYVYTFVFVSILSSLAPAQTTQPASEYRLPAIPAEFKDADAIILNWSQSWTLAADGQISYEESRRVLINNDRAIGAFADPRITYHADHESVAIATARTVLPNGRVIPVPAYSINEVSPGEAVGFPDFAAIRQKVVTFSGIEPGAILELSYSRTSKPAMQRCVEIEDRVHHPFPILVRDVSAQIGDKARFDRHFEKVPAMPDEPAAPHWRARCGTIQYSSCGLSAGGQAYFEAGVDLALQAVESAAGTSSAIRIAANEWTRDKTDPIDRLREIRDRLNKRLTVLNIPPASLPAGLRAGDRVRETGYGTAPEAAALFLAMIRAANIKAQPCLLFDEVVAEAQLAVPRSAIAAYGVAVKSGDETSYWTLADGRIRDPGLFGGRVLCCRSFDENAPQIERVILKSAGDVDSRVTIIGDVAVNADGNWTARLDLKVTGLFVRPDELTTQDQKRGAVQALVDRVLPDAQVDNFNVTSLTDESFGATAEVRSRSVLKELDGRRFLTLPQSGPWAARFDLPLARSDRRAAIRLPGPFRQDLRLALKLPDGWKASAAPQSLPPVDASWGSTRQSLESADGRLTLTQYLEVKKLDIPVSDYPALRDAFNRLQTPAARTFVLAPADKPAPANSSAPAQ